MRWLLLALALSGCQAYETVERTVSDHGTVYVCDTEQGCPGGTDEYCWNGSTAELERLLGAQCHPVRLDERIWPAITGCAYCCDGDCPRGANAHCGAFCP